MILRRAAGLDVLNQLAMAPQIWRVRITSDQIWCGANDMCS